MFVLCIAIGLLSRFLLGSMRGLNQGYEGSEAIASSAAASHMGLGWLIGAVITDCSYFNYRFLVKAECVPVYAYIL
jgi:hypothetical protein